MARRIIRTGWTVELASQRLGDGSEIGLEPRSHEIGEPEVDVAGMAIEPSRCTRQPMRQQEQLRRARVKTPPIVQSDQGQPDLAPLRQAPDTPGLSSKPNARRAQQPSVRLFADQARRDVDE